MYVIHRIVGIEEPNEKHPNERQFLLQGDAVENPDRFPVLYSQMQGIYEGERMPYIGSFLLFLQSPAGWLCVLLVVFTIIITPIVEKLIENEKRKRLALLLAKKAEEEEAEKARLMPKPEEPMPRARPSRSIFVFKYAKRRVTCEIGTCVLENYYQDGEVVDICSLKEKELINQKCESVKIISTGVLSKRLTVYADSCTKKAYHAIVEAGGSFEARTSSNPSVPKATMDMRGDRR